MTPREHWKALLPVIQAFTEGRPIQVKLKGEGEWQTYVSGEPNFHNENWEWRVKPEPREWWVVQPDDGPAKAYPFKQCAEIETAPNKEIIHVREVL